MPAIQPARLKKHVSVLAAKFGQPSLFVRELHVLLHRYSDYTHRAGQAGEPSPLISSYNTPPPVMRQIWLALTPLLKSRPSDVLPLCDTLWAEPNYDLQLLAARLLGQVSIDPPGPVIDRLQSWIRQGLDRRVLDGLLQNGLVRLQRDAPVLVMSLISTWLGSIDPTCQQAGLRALLATINGLSSEHMPAIFRMLTPYIRIAPARLRPDILAALSALIRHSPSETAFLLRQNLFASDNPDTAWLIRQVLDEFPAETRMGLKSAMKVEAR